MFGGSAHRTNTAFPYGISLFRSRNQIFMFKFIITLFVPGLFAARVCAQRMITEEEAIDFAVKNSGNVNASRLSVVQQKQLLKSSFNLPNTEVFVESPTGNFYTASITQSAEFPTVYTKQYGLQKQKIALAEKEIQLAEYEIKFQVRQLFLQWQYNFALQQQLAMQDTVYEQISVAAKRQFDAGQINYLQKIFAENQYNDIHNEYLQAKLSVNNTETSLQYLTGLREKLVAAPLNKDAEVITLQSMDSTAFRDNASVQIALQAEQVAAKNIALQRAKSLPGLAFGYFNQGEKSTPIRNRFRAGITLPLWQGQYRGNIQAAKTEAEISKQKTIGLTQQLSIQLLDAQNSLAANRQSLLYYQNTALPKANEIINTAKRFFSSGENDYIGYLRNINDAYAIQIKYLEALRNYQQSVLSVKFLKGTL